MASHLKIKRRKVNYSLPLPKDPGKTPSALLATRLDDLLIDACFVMGVKVEDIKGKWRDPMLVDTRALYAYAAKQMGYNLSAIGRYIDKHHASVCHYIKKFNGYLEEDKPWFRPDMKERVEKMMKRYD